MQRLAETGGASSRGALARIAIGNPTARLGALLSGVLSLAVVGCEPENVTLVLPPSPPTTGSVGACAATPSALAHLMRILPGAMGMDEFGLYVIASGADGSAAQDLWRVPKDGSAPQRIVSSATPIVSVALTGFETANEVFWTTTESTDADGGAMGSVLSLTLGATAEPVVIASNRRSPGALTVVAGRVYWAEQDVDPSGQLVEAIMAISTTGGAVTRVQTLDEDQVPSRFSSYDDSDLDASFEGLFWSTWNSEVGSEKRTEIVECPIPGAFGPQTRIAGPDAGGVAAMQFDDERLTVFYSGPQGIAEVAVALDGGVGAPGPVVDTGGFVDRIEYDDTDVYFVERATGTLMGAPRFQIDAQAPRTLARSVDPATAFQVDDACAYWIDRPSETIMMVSK
jgi:hypothetical protein